MAALAHPRILVWVIVVRLHVALAIGVEVKKKVKRGRSFYTQAMHTHMHAHTHTRTNTLYTHTYVNVHHTWRGGSQSGEERRAPGARPLEPGGGARGATAGQRHPGPGHQSRVDGARGARAGRRHPGPGAHGAIEQKYAVLERWYGDTRGINVRVAFYSNLLKLWLNCLEPSSSHTQPTKSTKAHLLLGHGNAQHRLAVAERVGNTGQRKLVLADVPLERFPGRVDRRTVAGASVRLQPQDQCAAPVERAGLCRSTSRIATLAPFRESGLNRQALAMR